VFACQRTSLSLVLSLSLSFSLSLSLSLSRFLALCVSSRTEAKNEIIKAGAEQQQARMRAEHMKREAAAKRPAGVCSLHVISSNQQQYYFLAQGLVLSPALSITQMQIPCLSHRSASEP
jgi:hypothetical protein